MSDPDIIQVVRSADEAFSRLLAELDREAENSDSIETHAEGAFHAILEAISIAEKSGGPEERKLAQHLFNRVIADLYAFEPVAHLAAAQRRKLVGTVGLAQLFCVGVAGFVQPELAPENLIDYDEDEVPEFEAVGELVRTGGVGTFSLDELAKRLARSAWYYIKWNPHRLRLAIQPASRALRIEVYEGDKPHAGAQSLSRGLDGWDVRIETGAAPVSLAIQGGMAVASLPARVDFSKFAIALRKSGQRDWTPLFGRMSGGDRT